MLSLLLNISLGEFWNDLLWNELYLSVIERIFLIHGSGGGGGENWYPQNKFLIENAQILSSVFLAWYFILILHFMYVGIYMPQFDAGIFAKVSFLSEVQCFWLEFCNKICIVSTGVYTRNN